jgi:hypothetical protein
MELLKRRSLTELAAIASALVLVALGFVAWNTYLGDDNGTEQEYLVAVAEATLTARAASPDPPATPTKLLTATPRAIVTPAPAPGMASAGPTSSRKTFWLLCRAATPGIPIGTVMTATDCG